MADSTAQVSLDTLLDFIAAHTVEHFKNTGRPSHGAVLAEAIRATFPDFSYQQIGLERLSDAIRVAEQRGVVTRHRNVKHLEILPGPKSAPQPRSNATGSFTPPYPHIRPEVWRAFVTCPRCMYHSLC